MQQAPTSPWSHTHVFDEGNLAAEKGTRVVMLITATMMLVEIAAGWWYNSMALLADGWHMSSHAVAIGLSALAYAPPGATPNDHRFAFGTWKIESSRRLRQRHLPARRGADDGQRLARTSAVAAADPVHRGDRRRHARTGGQHRLRADPACGAHGHGHSHDHGHPHAITNTDHEHHDHAHPLGDGHPHTHGARRGDHDLNLRAAYLHVVADAATSVLAIVALLGGMLYGWDWLDPLMGIVGSSSRRALGAGTDPRYRPCAP
jgi:Co/Zn/Cd efflux system component